jgi:hypothetical protein
MIAHGYEILENQLSCKYNIDKRGKEVAFMEVDVTQALKDAENALRDFIASILSKKLGAYWANDCGVSPERVQRWQERKAEEEKRQRFGTIEERLIYYADFYDLKRILKKNWEDEFSQAFGDWKIMEVWLDELGRLRDPDAHRRELLPHQKHLAIGIVGEIRTRIVRYRSKQETREDYYPRIESVRDIYGNIWTFESDLKSIDAGTILRPGDKIDIVITASDPFAEDIEYGHLCSRPGSMISPQSTYLKNSFWVRKNSFSITISEEDVGENLSVISYIRSLRKYHADKYYDDCIWFYYIVRPPRNEK